MHFNMHNDQNMCYNAQVKNNVLNKYIQCPFLFLILNPYKGQKFINFVAVWEGNKLPIVRKEGS